MFSRFVKAASIAVGFWCASISASAAATLVFSWDNTPISEIQTFTSLDNFNLILDNYSGIGREATGYTLVDSAGFVYTTDTQFCDPAIQTLFHSGCNLVRASTVDGTVLLGNLSAGDYSLGIFDSRTPLVGTLALTVQPVPLPAGSVLLLTGLFAAGFVARRRCKA